MCYVVSDKSATVPDISSADNNFIIQFTIDLMYNLRDVIGVICPTECTFLEIKTGNVHVTKRCGKNCQVVCVKEV